MHVAAANPLPSALTTSRQRWWSGSGPIFLEQIKKEGKPEHIAEKIVEGKLRKFFEESSLLKQPFVKDPQKSVEQLITEVSAKTGEKIEVARFARLQVGGGAEPLRGSPATRAADRRPAAISRSGPFFCYFPGGTRNRGGI